MPRMEHAIAEAIPGLQPLHRRQTNAHATFARLFSLPVVCSAVVAFWVFLLVPRHIQDPDIWWHLRNAGTQLHQHAFLHRDSYSYTAHGASWINHEWLAELPFYLGWHLHGVLGGTNGLYLVTLLTLEGIFLSIFRLTYRKSESVWAATLVTVAGALLSTVSFGPRTLLFGWALLLVQLFVLEIFTRRPRALFALPLLLALWVNVHGSWLIGLVLFIVFAASGIWPLSLGGLRSTAWSREQRRILAIVLPLSVAVLFVNPYGWCLVAYPFDLAFHQTLNIANVEEWQPLNFHSARGMVLLLSLAAIFFFELARSRAKQQQTWTLHELAFLAIGAYSAVMHARFLFLAAILVLPLLARQIACIFDNAPGAERPLLHGVMLFAMLLLAVRIAHTANNAETAGPKTAERFPVAALSSLEAFQPRGNVFNEFLWGGYLEYYAPQIPVFIDSRVDIFERRGVLRDYLDIVRLKNSLALLDKYQIRYVLFERDTPLVYLLQQTRAWKSDYDDGSVVLLERKDLLELTDTAR